MTTIFAIALVSAVVSACLVVMGGRIRALESRLQTYIDYRAGEQLEQQAALATLEGRVALAEQPTAACTKAAIRAADQRIDDLRDRGFKEINRLDGRCNELGNERDALADLYDGIAEKLEHLLAEANARNRSAAADCDYDESGSPPAVFANCRSTEGTK